VPTLAEVLEPQLGWFAEAHTVLADGWPAPATAVLRAAVGHALAFSTWHSLARDHGLSDGVVADLMTAMLGERGGKGVSR
jgi:hypothetical protein